MTMPHIFATQVGPIPLAYLDDNFNALAASGGSSNLGFIQSGTGAIAETVQDRLRTVLSPENYGAVGNGIADDTIAINAALAEAVARGGYGIWLKPGRRYLVSSKIAIASRCGFISDGTAEIYAPAASFTNATLATKYTSTSAVLDLSGLTTGPFTINDSPFLIGVRVTSEISQGRSVDAIVARNTKNLRILACEISGFPVGCDIRVSSLLGGWIDNNVLGTRTDDAVWGSAPQLTGVEVDGDRVNSVASTGTSICSNRIKDITVGATVLASWGYQTDGINLMHQSTSYLAINDNRIQSVGEGIDCFAKKCVFSGNTIAECYIFGMKFIHGASFNSIAGGSIHDVGLAGITFQGSGVAAVGDTERNVVTGLTISSINYNAAWTGSSSAGILFADNGGTTGKPNYNTVIGCHVSEGAAGKYGWLDTSTGASNANFGESIQFVVGAANVKRIEITAGGGTCRMAGDATYRTSLV